MILNCYTIIVSVALGAGLVRDTLSLQGFLEEMTLILKSKGKWDWPKSDLEVWGVPAEGTAQAEAGSQRF